MRLSVLFLLVAAAESRRVGKEFSIVARQSDESRADASDQASQSGCEGIKAKLSETLAKAEKSLDSLGERKSTKAAVAVTMRLFGTTKLMKRASRLNCSLEGGSQQDILKSIAAKILAANPCRDAAQQALASAEDGTPEDKSRAYIRAASILASTDGSCGAIVDEKRIAKADKQDVVANSSVEDFEDEADDELIRTMGSDIDEEQSLVAVSETVELQSEMVEPLIALLTAIVFFLMSAIFCGIVVTLVVYLVGMVFCLLAPLLRVLLLIDVGGGRIDSCFHWWWYKTLYDQGIRQMIAAGCLITNFPGLWYDVTHQSLGLPKMWLYERSYRR